MIKFRNWKIIVRSEKVIKLSQKNLGQFSGRKILNFSTFFSTNFLIFTFYYNINQFFFAKTTSYFVWNHIFCRKYFKMEFVVLTLPWQTKTFRATNGTETFLGTGRRTSVRKTLRGSSKLSFFFINCRKTIRVLTLPYSIGTLFNERTFKVYTIWFHNIQSIKELSLYG